MNLVFDSTKVNGLLFIVLTRLTKFLLKFCVDEVFKDRGAINMRRIKRGKSSSLGMLEAPQVNISEDTQASKLGDSLEGIPSFFNKYRYVFGFVSFMRYVQVLERFCI